MWDALQDLNHNRILRGIKILSSYLEYLKSLHKYKEYKDFKILRKG